MRFVQRESGKTMSVLIKGMEMPTSCTDCPFKGFDRVKGRGNICTINDSITLHAVLDGLDVKFVRMGDCPLIPVPPHGDLIDRDALLQRAIPHGWSTPKWVSDIAIEDAPTIIPAEEEGKR